MLEFSVTEFFQFSNQKLENGQGFYVHFLNLRSKFEKHEKKHKSSGLLSLSSYFYEKVIKKTVTEKKILEF